MEKALRRRCGAVAVDLDTRSSWAKYLLEKPRKIDLDEIRGAADAASYTLKRLKLEAWGDVVEQRCETCDKNVPWLRLPNGQLIELSGDFRKGRRVRVFGEFEGLDGTHPRLVPAFPN